MTYYWRVKSFSEGYQALAESSWSGSSSFEVTDRYLRLLSPVGGEKWKQDEYHFIQWEDNVAEDLSLELYRNHQLVGQLAVHRK